MVIAVAAMGFLALAQRVPRAIHGLNAFAGEVVAAIGTAVMMPCEMAVEIAADHPQVKALVGSPLEIVSIDDVASVEGAEDTQLSIDFTAAGPRGKVRMHIIAEVVVDRWQLVALEVEPIDTPAERFWLIDAGGAGMLEQPTQRP